MIDQKNYIQAEKEISLLNLNIDKIDKIEDEAIFDIILSSRKILKKYFKKKISLNSTQIPRGGKESLNCGRHMKIFEKFEISGKKRDDDDDVLSRLLGLGLSCQAGRGRRNEKRTGKKDGKGVSYKSSHPAIKRFLSQFYLYEYFIPAFLKT